MSDDTNTLAATDDNGTATPFGDPAGGKNTRREWTIDDVLTEARVPEDRARVCMRADLQARHNDLVAELATLVNTAGEVIDDDGETPLGESSPADRARAAAHALQQVREEMAQAMWMPLFRGLPSEDLETFNKIHTPKSKDTPMGEYQCHLIAACSIDSDPITVEKARALKKKLSNSQWRELVDTVIRVNTEGGVSVPKSPVSLLNLTRQ